jgi:hypothetical protein
MCKIIFNIINILIIIILYRRSTGLIPLKLNYIGGPPSPTPLSVESPPFRARDDAK